MQKFVTLSVTEAKIASGVMVAQDMLYIYCSLESLKLKMELPMVLEMDNSGAVDIAKSGLLVVGPGTWMYETIFYAN